MPLKRITHMNSVFSYGLQLCICISLMLWLFPVEQWHFCAGQKFLRNLQLLASLAGCRSSTELVHATFLERRLLPLPLQDIGVFV